MVWQSSNLMESWCCRFFKDSEISEIQVRVYFLEANHACGYRLISMSNRVHSGGRPNQSTVGWFQYLTNSRALANEVAKCHCSQRRRDEFHETNTCTGGYMWCHLVSGKTNCHNQSVLIMVMCAAASNCRQDRKPLITKFACSVVREQIDLHEDLPRDFMNNSVTCPILWLASLTLVWVGMRCRPFLDEGWFGC